MKKTTAVSILVALFTATSPAHAGWFDSFFGSDEDTAVETVDSASTVVKKVEAAPAAQTEDLVASVKSQLGLNQQQAEGGLGTLLKLAQSNLGDSDFSQLAKSIPGTDSLLSAVPSMGDDDGVAGLLSKAGDLGESMQGAAMVYDAFEKLGIKQEYIGPMINIAKTYLETNGTDGTVDLLMKGVGALL